ncbi:MAG: methyltransferase domain-containing protein [Pseudomonadota bacterium]
MTDKQFLLSAYELDSAEQTRSLYRDWAATYDEEISANGYVTPHRTAEALTRCGAQLEQPILDIGCGSGLSGELLHQAGFTELHGSDFSQPMLDLAKEKQLYNRLHLADLNDPFNFVEAPYHSIAAIGVMAPGHAGPELISAVLDLLHAGGLFGFSMNDHTLDNPNYQAEIYRLLMDRKIRIRWNEYGDHLPGIDLNSIIMVIEKLR